MRSVAFFEMVLKDFGVRKAVQSAPILIRAVFARACRRKISELSFRRRAKAPSSVGGKGRAGASPVSSGSLGSLRLTSASLRVTVSLRPVASLANVATPFVELPRG